MVTQSLPKNTRILRKEEIDRVFRKGRRLRDVLLRIHVYPNQRGSARLAISVPRRLCNAVLRNRWKRLLRESFRLHRQKMKGVDLLAIPNRSPDGLKRQDVETVLVRLLKRAGQIRS